MRRFLIVLFLCGAQPMIAQEASLLFEQANQLYRNGRYQEAAARYEQVVTNGYESPALYYNLGNAYFKLKNIPAAILNYERARRLAPHDEDIVYNLRLANLRIVDRIDPVPQLFFIDWWQSLLNMFSSGGWAIAAIASLWCAALGGLMFMFLRSASMQRIGFFLCALSLTCCGIASVGTMHQYRHEYNDQMAIVFSPSVAVKSSPDVKSTDLFVLHEGIKVDVLDNVGEWKKIRLADGKIGWMPTDALQVM